jgi:Ca-activated chloride channel family protein
MSSTLMLKLRSISPGLWGIAFLLCSGLPAFCQTPPSPATPAQSSIPAAMPDPTRPEAQPPLDVDRDPIPSPDATNPVETITPSSSKATQSVESRKGAGIYTMHAEVDEVLLDCTVIDDKGRTVSGLTQNDFRVWEDGVPQVINSVQHQDVPVSLGILVDNSGSMIDKRTAVNNAAFNLVKESNPKDEAFVVNFSDRAFLDQGFTSDLVALNRGLSRFDSKGMTALYDAVAAAGDELSKHGKHRKEVLLIITDGADNASRLTLQEAIRRVQDLGGPVVYCVGLLFDANQEESDRARTALERLSEETGGVAYFPHSLQDVNSVAAEVAHDIRDQYTVDYHSSKPASLGGYRTVHVEAVGPNHRNLIVRTRRGYYAKAVPQSQIAKQ